MKPTILVVDDEAVNRQLYFEMFKNDFDVFTLSTGETAVKYCIENQPELIVLDLFLPVINGYEVIRQLKSIDITKNIPVILITAHMNSRFEVLNELDNFSKSDIFIKPFDILKVRKRISELINESHESRRHLSRRNK